MNCSARFILRRKNKVADSILYLQNKIDIKNILSWIQNLYTFSILQNSFLFTIEMNTFDALRL